MKKRNILLLIMIGIIALGASAYYSRPEGKEAPLIDETAGVRRKIMIAVCPTYYEIAEKLDASKYRIIPAVSTAESIELIKSGQAAIMLAGRTLKPNEPRMEEIIIGDGYSFISSREITVTADELKDYAVYTDLDIGLIKNYFPVEKIEKVDDVYPYLNRGIAVTSWENTDYAKAKIVHLTEIDGRRVKLSRRPAIYCPKNCGAEAKELALLLK